ncbi:MAG: DUF3298 and DUF4163 domain-containing protein [Clostridiales bacterium]|nr:DUF3298 and DUF4163 domain-containing protein [Clostridiales bacterium]
MTEKEKIDELKREFNNIEVPDEVNFIVREAILRSKKNVKGERFFNMIRKTGIAAAVLFAGFIVSVNSIPAMAKSLLDMPFVGPFVKVFVFTDYKTEENGFEANISVPNIAGFENKQLENELNEKFIKEGQKLYDDFLRKMEEIKSNTNDGHYSVNSGYEVCADNEDVFSIIVYNTSVMASSATEYKAYTVDKKNNSVVTLESLFKDKSYINIISENIKEQMKEQMKADENKIYFIYDETASDDYFKQIKAEQNFYIDNKGKLVIMFNDYEVAPGYMGAPKFEIPTDILDNILLDRELIK